MSGLRLLSFECKKQLKNLTFIAVIILFSVFAVSQLIEIFYLPIISDKDIQSLADKSPDVNQYVYMPNTDDEKVKALSRDFLQRVLDENKFEQNVVSELQAVIEMLQVENYTFDEVMAATVDYEYIPSWLISCKSQFNRQLATIEEANQNIKLSLGVKGYSPTLYKNYVTYMQIMLTFLIFPIFLLVFIKDYKDGISEIVYVQPISSSKYLLCKYLSVFIPTSAYLYLFGIVLNAISACRFLLAGFEYQYTFFTPYFLLYIFPSLFFMSAVITVLMLLIKKAVAVLPVYIIYVLFNVTPRTFTFGKENIDWIYIINPIIRLDHDLSFGMPAILLNRLIYICLGGVLMIAACQIYKKLRKNMRGAITL